MESSIYCLALYMVQHKEKDRKQSHEIVYSFFFFFCVTKNQKLTRTKESNSLVTHMDYNYSLYDPMYILFYFLFKFKSKIGKITK